jgi:hypothetical protein
MRYVLFWVAVLALLSLFVISVFIPEFEIRDFFKFIGEMFGTAIEEVKAESL